MSTVIIIGAGVIGSSVAFQLSTLEPSTKIIVIERCEVACAASGKAGGFLALDWCNGKSLDALARLSFRMHANFAAELNGAERYGYREVDTFSVTASTARGKQKTDTANEAASQIRWLDQDIVRQTSRMGSRETTAQVHPYLFTKTMLEEAQKRGQDVTLKIGTVTGLELDDEGFEIRGVRLESGEILEAGVVVIAMGPWSSQASEWLPKKIPITAMRAHSIVMRTPKPVDAQCLFVCLKNDMKTSEPEVYPRPDQTIYVCGECDNEPLPEDPAAVNPSSASIDRLHSMIMKLLASDIGSPIIEKRQACHLPLSEDGNPLIGPLPGVKGLYFATGHGCWGILNAPATGLVVAELILGRKISVDISDMSLDRLTP